MDSVEVRWTSDGFQNFFQNDYETDQKERQKMCTGYVVAKCKNCKDDSSCWRVDMVQQNKEKVYSLAASTTRKHYRIYHDKIYKHHEYASNLC